MRLFPRPILAFTVSILVPFTVAAVLITSRPAYADTITFNYTTFPPPKPSPFSGSGSFVYNGSPSSLTLASLTGFTFTDTFNLVPPTFTSNFTYSLADLISFSATLSGDTLVTLSLQTGFEPGDNPIRDPNGRPIFAPESFTVTNLDFGGSTTQDNGRVGLTSTGRVTQTGSSVSSSPVPEPSALAFFGIGILSLTGAARRKFRSR
ncbi:MAG TPA: PEP-CTERM sorting domain-containing protein [Edaphobacter sp.]